MPAVAQFGPGKRGQIRLSPETHKQLYERATRNRRSFTKEATFIIEEALKRDQEAKQQEQPKEVLVQ